MITIGANPVEDAEASSKRLDPHGRPRLSPWKPIRGDFKLDVIDWVCPSCHKTIHSDVSGKRICQRCGLMVFQPLPDDGEEAERKMAAWHDFMKVKSVRRCRSKLREDNERACRQERYQSSRATSRSPMRSSMPIP